LPNIPTPRNDRAGYIAAQQSVASAESHIRAACDPSNARKLGSPIIPPTRDRNDSKITASTGYVQEKRPDNVYRFSAARKLLKTPQVKYSGASSEGWRVQ
jgi:hypothetical protein